MHADTDPPHGATTRDRWATWAGRVALATVVVHPVLALLVWPLWTPPPNPHAPTTAPHLYTALSAALLVVLATSVAVVVAATTAWIGVGLAAARLAVHRRRWTVPAVALAVHGPLLLAVAGFASLAGWLVVLGRLT